LPALPPASRAPRTSSANFRKTVVHPVFITQ
jgi:hypothetical protein